jgi:hypothetical protein
MPSKIDRTGYLARAELPARESLPGGPRAHVIGAPDERLTAPR